MPADTFFADIAQSETGLDWCLTTPDSRHWPEVIYAAPDGFRPLTLSVTTPPGPGPHPCVVYIHGGAWLMGHPNYTNPVLRQMRITPSLVAAGYAVARISYRMSSEAVFPAQLHDCKAAVRFLRAHAATLGIDPARIASMGESAGGHLALLLGLVQGDTELEGNLGVTDQYSTVSCVVNWYAPTDLPAMAPQKAARGFPEWPGPSPEDRLIGGDVARDHDAARRASPLAHVSAAAPPILIQHGQADRLVPIDQARALYTALQKAGTTVELAELAGADHCWWGIDSAIVMPQVTAFLRQYL
jgi:acetyl esterase/lipase